MMLGSLSSVIVDSVFDIMIFKIIFNTKSITPGCGFSYVSFCKDKLLLRGYELKKFIFQLLHSQKLLNISEKLFTCEIKKQQNENIILKCFIVKKAKFRPFCKLEELKKYQDPRSVDNWMSVGQRIIYTGTVSKVGEGGIKRALLKQLQEQVIYDIDHQIINDTQPHAQLNYSIHEGIDAHIEARRPGTYDYYDAELRGIERAHNE